MSRWTMRLMMAVSLISVMPELAEARGQLLRLRCTDNQHFEEQVVLNREQCSQHQVRIATPGRPRALRPRTPYSQRQSAVQNLSAVPNFIGD